MARVDCRAFVLPSRRGNASRLLIAFVSVLGLVACQAPSSQPVDIVAEDMCTYCRMAISEKRYAVQFVDQEGQASKFDDVGCMMSYLRSRKAQDPIAHYYVVDFDSHRWITASQAYFVHSSQYKTPMGGATVAFEHKSRAEQAAGEFHGLLMSFSELRDFIERTNANGFQRNRHYCTAGVDS